MDKPKITPKDFFLWAGAMVAFYWSVIAFIFLLFNYINYAFPNALSYYPANPYESGISHQMASIIVLFPLYLWLMQVIRKGIERDPSRKEIWVRRWALILTLFVAGVAIAVDLITLLTTFLNGAELTTAFLLKVLVILLVAGGVFAHMSADLKGYWEAHPARRSSLRAGVGILVVATILSGFVIVGTPADARLARFDAERVADLQDIQSRIIYFWQAKQKMPGGMDSLADPLSYGPLPSDPETGEPYAYLPGEGMSFKLCATFNKESAALPASRFESPMMPARPVGKGMMEDNWRHGAGEHCFERIIDPSFYPPLSKVQP